MSLVVLFLVVSLLPAVPVMADPAVTPALPVGADPALPPAPAQVSTPVTAGKPGAPRASQTDTAVQAVATRRRLPVAGMAEVSTSGVISLVGGLPVSVRGGVGSGEDVLSESRHGPGDFWSGPAGVRVQVAARETAVAAGVSAVLMALSPAQAVQGAGKVILALDYGEFAELFGADYGQRLRLVRLPACAVSTPVVRECQVQRELSFVNRGGWLSAEVVFEVGAGPLVVAVTSGVSSPGATFGVSSLSPVYSWSAGGQGGGFSWGYPLKVPAGLGGPVPELALTYDSGSVDGQTLAANGQTSWVGEGWDLSVGYVERSYRSCAQDGGTTNVGDLCWFSSYNATLMFGGRSYKLVRDHTSGLWKTDDDGALRVEQLFDMSLGNGDNDGEYWRVTTLDGIQYFFGRHKRYAGDPAVTDSVQRVPVWGNNAGEPCASTSWCMQGYRWNLDYVVDARGNSMTYFYTKHGGNYGFNGNRLAVAYDIESYLDHVDYGTRAGSEGLGLPPARVGFTKAYRCRGGCVIGSVDFPDTPWDLHCTASSCPTVTSPTFWSPFRLSVVQALVRKADGSGMRQVDAWTLGQLYPTTYDLVLPAGDDTSPNLWLGSISHLGYAEDGVTAVAEPEVSFGGVALGNRVDWGNDIGVAPYVHYRLSSILNGAGGQTLVTYSGVDCPLRSLKPAPGFNPYRCFPQFYKPAGAAAGYGWFYKFVTAQVTEVDLTPVGGPDEVWSYAYGVGSSTDSALWAHDFHETTQLAYRTWSLWRGYSDVTTVHGPAGGTQTVSKTQFYRGMHGDSLASWDNQAMVWGSRAAGLTTTLTTPGQTGGIGGVGGRCWDTAGGGTGDGTAVHLWDCGGAGSQQWRYHLDTLAFTHPSSGRCLHTTGAGNGAAVQIRSCTGGTAQIWVFQPDGSLRNPVSGRCLDAPGASTANGTLLILWDCLGGWNQVWQQTSTATVISPQTRRCIDVAGAGNGSAAVTWTCHGGVSQQWSFQPSGSSLRNPSSGRCLDASGTANGALVALFTCNDTAAQAWAAQPDGSLKNPASGRCLDALAAPAPGSQLVIWDCTGGLTQRFAHQLTDEAPLSGRSREQFTLDGPGTVLASTVHSYTVTPTALRLTPVTGGQDLRAYQARETSTKSRTWIAATSSWRWTDAATAYDSYGLPVDVRNDADMATTTDDTCTHTDYNRNPASYLLNTAKETITTTCAGAGILAGTHVYYDNATTDTPPTSGLPTKSMQLSSATGGVLQWIQAARTSYDMYGRVIESFDALDRKTSTAYLPASGAPVISFIVTGPMGAAWTTTTVIDPGHGSVKSVTDANGKATKAAYDPLGRLAKVWLDNRPVTGTPNRQHTYTPGNPSSIHTQTLGPNGNQISSYAMFDGRLRPRQTHTTAPDGKRTITDTRYDARGLPVKQSIFYDATSPPAAQIVSFADTAVARQTRLSYDTLQRKTREQLFSNNVFQFETTMFHDGDRTGTVPPPGGTATQNLADVRGNVVQKRQYQTGMLTGTFDTTSYSYDRLGRLATVTDPGNNVWTYKYDLLSRKTQAADPDTGLSKTVYDNAGQITSTEDSRAQKLFYEYDLAGRKTRQRSGTPTGPILASWTYDTLAKGQLTSMSRFHGADTYTFAVTSYDDGYRPLTTLDTIPGFGPGGSTLSYPVTHTYSASGTPATTAVPGVGGLPTETLAYGYTDQGMPDTITSAQTTYVADTIHAYDGAVVRCTVAFMRKTLHKRLLWRAR